MTIILGKIPKIAQYYLDVLPVLPSWTWTKYFQLGFDQDFVPSHEIVLIIVPVESQAPTLIQLYHRRQDTFVQYCLISCSVHCAVNAQNFAYFSCSKALSAILNYYHQIILYKSRIMIAPDIPPVFSTKMSTLITSDDKIVLPERLLLINMNIVEMTVFRHFHKKWLFFEAFWRPVYWFGYWVSRLRGQQRSKQDSPERAKQDICFINLWPSSERFRR